MSVQFAVVEGVLFLCDHYGNIVSQKQISGELDGSGNQVNRLVTSPSSEGPVDPGTVALKSSLAGVQYKSVQPTLTDGQQAALQCDVNGNLYVRSSPVVDISTTGTIGALNATVTLACSGFSAHSITVTGTWSASLILEVSADNGSTWVTTPFHGTVGALGLEGIAIPPIFTYVTTNGTYKSTSAAVITHVRIKAYAYTSGSAQVLIRASTTEDRFKLTQSSIIQQVFVSAKNSSVANLNAGAAFNGTSESTLGVNACQINFKADQNCTIQYKQSVDGSNWDIVDTYTVLAGVGDGRTFQCTASYFTVTVTNNGASATTYLRLQSVLCPIVEALPRALSQGGGLKTAVYDSLGNAVTTASNGFAGSRLLHTQTPDTTTDNSTLGALNATTTISCAGMTSIGFQIDAGSLIGTLTPESSVDGGTTWIAALFIDPISSNSSQNVIFASSNTLRVLGIVPIGGASHVRVRVTAYTSGSASAKLRASCVSSIVPTNVQVVSPFPAAEITMNGATNAGATKYSTYTATVRLALKEFYAGGTGIGKQTVWRYLPALTLLSEYGNFESAGDVSQWTVVDPGGNLPTVSYSTDQAYTGTGSAKIVFTKSDINNYTGLRRTYATPMDVSVWKYITAAFYNIPPVGGGVTRTISIILIDSGGITCSHSLSGNSVTGPYFNATGWVYILGDIRNPTSSSGTFDKTSVVSIELRFVDSGNKAGTIYWDSVYFKEGMTMLLPIYHPANGSLPVVFDPVKILEIGDQILFTQTNNDTTRKEYFCMAGAIAI